MWHATIVSSICFLDYTCDTTSKSCRNISFKILNKPWNLVLKIRKNLTLWPKLIFQTCTKLLSTCLSSPTSTTVTTSTSFELPSPHARVTLIKFTKQEWVSDKGKQWSDSGPIKRKNWVHSIKKLKWHVWQLININQGSFIFKIMNFKEIHTFFLGLECFYRHPNSKMSNHKLKYISFLLLGILDSNTKMGNETAGYFASTLKL